MTVIQILMATSMKAGKEPSMKMGKICMLATQDKDTHLLLEKPMLACFTGSNTCVSAG